MFDVWHQGQPAGMLNYSLPPCPEGDDPLEIACARWHHYNQNEDGWFRVHLRPCHMLSLLRTTECTWLFHGYYG
jgi:hypothetical protein